MIHTFSVVIELKFNDENGEYDPPATSEIETKISNTLFQPLRHMGFDIDYDVEAAKGDLSEAFGIGE